MLNDWSVAGTVSALAALLPMGAAAQQSITVSTAQLFAYADAARDAGDYATAEQAYRGLAQNVDPELRIEARFRLAMMLADRQNKWRDAAVLFRQILDERPKAARVRLELVRMQAMMGHIASAERELRAASAGGLPPEVERMVRFYAGALAEKKPVSFTVEAAMAPDTNINRATRSEKLGTIIGDFTLDEDARAKSGLGLSLRGQAWARRPLSQAVSLLARVSGSADIYGESQFDDMIVAAQVGPEFRSGADRITISAGPGWRWYGRQPFTATLSATVIWQNPLGRRDQLRIEGGAGHVTNRRNPLQSGQSYSLGLGYDRAFTERSGGGLSFSAGRDAANDPGYALASGGVGAYVFREFGRTTAAFSLGYSHLEADARLSLYPRRRIEDRFTATLSGTFRALQIGPLAPLARLRWERNRSTVEIFDYRRLGAELGFAAAF